MLEAVAPDEDFLAFSWARARLGRPSRGTFWSIHFLLLPYDIVRSKLALREMRTKSIDLGFPLDRRMGLLVTSRRLVIWSADRRFRRLRDQIGEVLLGEIDTATTPFVGGLHWRTVRIKSSKGWSIQFQVAASTLDEFITALNEQR